MTRPAKSNVLSSIVVLGLALVLIALAVLQYRWSREISEAAGARMKASLQASMTGFRQDLQRELGTICATFQGDLPAREGWTSFAQQYQAWSRTAAHPALVSGVFIWQYAGTPQAVLLRLDPLSNRFERAAWPAGYVHLQERLAAASAEFAQRAERFRPADDSHRPADHRPTIHIPAGGPWGVEQDLPALVRPLIIRFERDRNPHAQPAMDWLIIALDANVLRERLLPELAERHFAGPEGLEYEVAVLGAHQQAAVYSSDSGFGRQSLAAMDATLEIFGGPSGPPGPRRGFLVPRGPEGGDRPREQYEGRLPRFEPIHYAAQDQDWLLVVKHRKGSLDAVVAGMRRRSLAISFGVLLVLAATMAMIIVASQRAHRLAKLQMDFVAGVSHELRTPLAVISSAADNLADGVIDSKQQLVKYGSVIRKQARQLGLLVEQILRFAATQRNGLRYALRPLAVNDVINAALNNTAELVHAAGITVERTLEPNLPLVTGDLDALSHCLQNLITNAVKYGGADRWIGIRAHVDAGGERQIQISIADHGAGIEAAELRRIFEPFYRSPEVTDAQIHGSGLGLTIARSIAEAMGGRLTVTSEPGKGSTFTVHLPIAEAVTEAAAAGADASQSA